MSEIATRESDRISRFFKTLHRMSVSIERLAGNTRPMLNGERYLTDKEVSARLKVSRRSLQEYRNAGRIPYFKLGGKALYRESDVQRLLDEGYHEAYRR